MKEVGRFQSENGRKNSNSRRSAMKRDLETLLLDLMCLDLLEERKIRSRSNSYGPKLLISDQQESFVNNQMSPKTLVKELGTLIGAVVPLTEAEINSYVNYIISGLSEDHLKRVMGNKTEYASKFRTNLLKVCKGLRQEA